MRRWPLTGEGAQAEDHLATYSGPWSTCYASTVRKAGDHDDESLEQRKARQGRRVHINTGALCNNNCLFCMESDREARRIQISAITPSDVRTILEDNRGAEEVCFTSGEPTLNPHLPTYAAWSRELGFERVSVMTNGRLLSHVPSASKLVEAGMNRFYISVHGHQPKLHDGLTRTPGSFAQTVRGIDVIKALARRSRAPVELHTSTVVNKRNLPYLEDIYSFLRTRGVDQVVFNVMQANGRADTYFDQLFPRYSDIADTFRRVIAEAPDTHREERVNAFLVDIPPCVTEGIPDFNRGFVEAHTHFGTAQEAAGLLGGAVPDDRFAVGDLVEITRTDIDRARRSWHSRCSSCRYRSVCEGVWDNYLARFGWDEFQPVR